MIIRNLTANEAQFKYFGVESLIQFNRPMQRDITNILNKVKNDKKI
ncbi:hypothetical protein ACNM7U_08750 [Aerococcus viridans]